MDDYLSHFQPNTRMAYSIGFSLILAAAYYLYSKMKTRGAGVQSMAGRLGLVVHWLSIFVALVLIGLGVLSLVYINPSNQDDTFVGVGIFWIAALAIWLGGKAVRFVLTGPLPVG